DQSDCALPAHHRAGRLLRFGQDHAAADGEPDGGADQRSGAHRRRGRGHAEPGDVAAPDRVRAAGRRAAAAPAGAGQHRHRAAAERSLQARGGGSRAGADGHSRARPHTGPALPRSALRRAAAAGGGCPGVGGGSEHPVDGRAVRRGRPDRTHRPAERAGAAAVLAGQDRAVRHPRHRRGVHPRSSGGDPQARWRDRPAGHPGGDPRRPCGRLRGDLHRRGAGAAGAADRGPRRHPGGGGRARPAGRGPHRGGLAPVTWFTDNLADVWDLSIRHLWLSVQPIVIGFVLAVPLGLAAWRYRRLRGGLLTVIGLLYTIPSLALFVLLPPVIGISVLADANLVIALSIYAVALMTRFAADAFAAVDPMVRRSAVAIGYSSWRRVWAVDLPLAGPALLAGLRVVAVSTVSLVSVGILVGIDSRGLVFTDGLQRGILVEIATGIVMTVVIALLLDLVLALAGRLLMPWARRPPRRRRSRPGSAPLTSARGAPGAEVAR